MREGGYRCCEWGVVECQHNLPQMPLVAYFPLFSLRTWSTYQGKECGYLKKYIGGHILFQLYLVRCGGK